jgi:hypothetical protein
MEFSQRTACPNNSWQIANELQLMLNFATHTAGVKSLEEY